MIFVWIVCPRWLEESSKTPDVHTFSYGRHSCLGMSLARAEIKMVRTFNIWMDPRADPITYHRANLIA
jgi:hypothetical protein